MAKAKKKEETPAVEDTTKAELEKALADLAEAEAEVKTLKVEADKASRSAPIMAANFAALMELSQKRDEANATYDKQVEKIRRDYRSFGAWG